MKNIYWGKTIIKQADGSVSGSILEIRGEKYYRIANYDRLPPFLMSIVSGSDHWMFVSSTGGLSCGRGNPDKALFPYDTDDKIHDSSAHTGPQTCLLVVKDGRTYLWKPFSADVAVYEIRRNLYKSLVGNRLIFEEINHDLGLIFSYGWSTSDRFGFVKTTRVRNTGGGDVAVEVLDGIRNVLPPGITHEMQSRLSTLADAYKKAEIETATGAGIFSLSATPSDRAEPGESLKASLAWSLGLGNSSVMLAAGQVDNFCAGLPLSSDTAKNGQRGAFFLQAEFIVPPGGEKQWYVLADVDLGPSELQLLIHLISRGISRDEIEADVEAGTRHLWNLVGAADGCQFTSDERVSGRHFANTLFNIMRGGTFTDEYRIRHDDFLDFVTTWNRPLRDRFSRLLAPRENPLSRASLLKAVEASGDAHMKRLVLEFLPLSFSRRHGDPSRPWNRFNIDIKTSSGREKLHYQGNWRDIFQNWEALAISYPEYVDSFIARFVNASTVDGYNPYRISSDGFDWEVPDAEDAWSNIGYWGDHQVNYLSRLLELSQRYHPGRIAQLLDQDIFVYADVPYRIKGYKELLGHPRDSIEFDQEHARRVAERNGNIGTDGKFVTLSDESIYRVSLLEKLLVTVLCKLGNFVPGGGIWMNTQRPEWNDANNALAGFGLSIVTLCYLRRLLEAMACPIRDAEAESFVISSEVAQFFQNVKGVLAGAAETMTETTRDRGRKEFMDEMGARASDYRECVYDGFSGKQSTLKKRDVLNFIDLARVHLDHTLGLSNRPDGLFHSYNLIQFRESGYSIERLPEMLEGQVAALSSGFLEPEDSLALLDELRKSKIYRSDQDSYMLYPFIELPHFLNRNIIPQSMFDKHPQLRAELESGGNEIVEQDINGGVHFNGAFMNAADLRVAIAEKGNISKADEEQWCEVFEAVFKHREFTGRSGTMYKYEGLGCIYWHMVSKLLLAVFEVLDRARGDAVDESIREGLARHFEHIRGGLGQYKSPTGYGAIPLDPYSHTPGFAGAQQPGMTGQVKEDFISRYGELGVVVKEGSVSFEPYLLSRDEFIPEEAIWHFSLGEGLQSETLEAGSLAFSLCGTPVIYRLAKVGSIHVFAENEQPEVIQGANLGKIWSQSLFCREKRIRKILVNVHEDVFQQFS